MSTRDLRFFDFPDAQALPDGQPRRGISVVAALSDWLVHTNRRQEGAWTQRYEHGVPETALVEIEGDGTTGTTVRFLADEPLREMGWPTAAGLARLAASWRELAVDVTGPV